jgi:hypothetical protein
LLKWPGAMAVGSGVGPGLSSDDLRALGMAAEESGVWVAALCVPAMGDAKVPDLAQLACTSACLTFPWTTARGLLDALRSRL